MDETREECSNMVRLHVIEEAGEDTLGQQQLITTTDFTSHFPFDLGNVFLIYIPQSPQNPLHTFLVFFQNHLAALFQLSLQVTLQLLQLSLFSHLLHLLH